MPQRPFFSLILVAAPLALAALALTLTLVSGAVPRASVRLPAPLPLAVPGAPGCSARAERSLDRLVLGEGETLRVRTVYDYDCPAGNRRVDFFLVVGNRSPLAPLPLGPLALAPLSLAPLPLDPSPDSGELLANLKAGLQDFVAAADFGRGTYGGLIVYGDRATTVVPLVTGEAGRRRLSEAIEGLSLTSATTGGGLSAAILEAVRQLPTAGRPFESAIVLVDGGMPLDSGGETRDDVEQACSIAAGLGILRAVVGLVPAGDRLTEIRYCANWMYVSESATGSDLPGSAGLFAQVASRLLRASEVEGSELTDRVTGEMFDYLPGSALVDGHPQEPEQPLHHEYTWVFSAPPPPGGRVIEYTLKAYDDAGEGIQPVSHMAELALILATGEVNLLALDNPDVCVWSHFAPDYCADFLRTLTPEPPTATPGPETPQPSPTAPPRRAIWLPYAAAAGGAGGVAETGE